MTREKALKILQRINNLELSDPTLLVKRALFFDALHNPTVYRSRGPLLRQCPTREHYRAYIKYLGEIAALNDDGGERE